MVAWWVGHATKTDDLHPICLKVRTEVYSDYYACSATIRGPPHLSAVYKYMPVIKTLSMQNTALTSQRLRNGLLLSQIGKGLEHRLRLSRTTYPLWKGSHEIRLAKELSKP